MHVGHYQWAGSSFCERFDSVDLLCDVPVNFLCPRSECWLWSSVLLCTSGPRSGPPLPSVLQSCLPWAATSLFYLLSRITLHNWAEVCLCLYRERKAHSHKIVSGYNVWQILESGVFPAHLLTRGSKEDWTISDPLLKARHPHWTGSSIN